LFKLALSWILYTLGDLVSRLMYYVDSGTLYTIYNKLMIWSCYLDPAGKIWEFPEDEEDSS
jgi:hypothetical protein